MKTGNALLLLAGFVAVTLATRAARAGCGQDSDCKAGRVCQSGECVEAPSAAAPALSACAKDADCKGDRVCESGKCVDKPAPAGAPADKPAPAVAPADKPAAAAAAATDTHTEPRVADSAAAAASAVGLYVSAVIGGGGPFGSQTVVGDHNGSIKGGIGGLGVIGYGFHPNFGIDAFFHYNSAGVEWDSGQTNPPSGSGHAMFYGIEARGMLGSGPALGWASLGLAMGSISANQEATNTYGTTHTDLSTDIKISPVIAFGFDFRVIPNLGIGPHARWYMTSYDKPCSDSTATANGISANEKECASSTSGVLAPSVAFFGIGATYYMH